MEKIKISLGLLFVVVGSSIAGYHFIEGMTLLEAVYMTVITIATVGFQEVHPLSDSGRIFTIFVIILGVSVWAYAIGNFLGIMIEGELKKTFGRKKLENKISKLKDHYIICGFGRIGGLICEELHRYKKQFVVIDVSPDSIERLETLNYLFIPANATEDETLSKAGIAHAKAFVAAVRSDADNVFITLTARGLNPDIFILARASDESTEIKLKRAGANRVVSPYMIGGKRMAQVLIRPTVVDFIDIAIMDSNIGLVMEELKIEKDSLLDGKTIVESNLRRDFGLIIVLIKKHDGRMIFNPAPSEKLECLDVIVFIGKKEDLQRLNNSL